MDFQLNRQSQAEESLDKTLALQPGHSGAIKHLAELSYTRHDYTRTAELLGQFPASELGLRENSLYLRLTGSSYFELGLHSRAVALYQEVLKKHSQNAEAYLTLGKNKEAIRIIYVYANDFILGKQSNLASERLAKIIVIVAE